MPEDMMQVDRDMLCALERFAEAYDMEGYLYEVAVDKKRFVEIWRELEWKTHQIRKKYSHPFKKSLTQYDIEEIHALKEEICKLHYRLFHQISTDHD